MEHLLFAAYLVLFAWLATKISFFKNSGISSPQLIIIFLLKVIAGIFYGWIGVYYGQLAQMVDTWSFHYESIEAYQLLLKDPGLFFHSLFHNNYEEAYGNFLSSNNSWWNDLHNNAFTFLLSFFNILSFGNYYINVIFYSFLTLLGPVAIYRVMKDMYPGKELLILLVTFLLPSFIYWTSGIHKDGIIFAGLSLIIYNVYFGLKERHFSWTKCLLVLMGLALLLVLRNYLLVIIVPAMLAWFIAERFKNKAVLSFVLTYFFFAVLFFVLPYIQPKLNFPAIVAEKQESFLKLQGGSAVPVPRLEANFSSFVKNAPEAFALSVLRPYPSDVKHLLSLAASVEINVLLLCFILFLFLNYYKKQPSPFLLFCVFFSFSTLFTIGYTVNFLGAVVRYRSITLPLLVIPMMMSVNWKKLGAFLKK